MGFHSIVFDRPETSVDVDGQREPAFFRDLNLDQVVASMTAGRREKYGLEPFFYVPLRNVAAVQFRHEVLRDLEQAAVFDAVDAFVEAIRRLPDLPNLDKLYRYQRAGLFLEAVEAYIEAVRSLAEELARLEVASGGLQGFRDYLVAYSGSDRFGSLVAETQALKDALAGVRYTVQIRGDRVRVARYEGEADYSVEVEGTFAKFKQGAVRDYRVEFRDAGMNHVEAQIVELVARLFPEVFLPLDEYYTRQRDYLDPAIRGFAREAPFYLAYLEYTERFRSAGLPFCYPHVSARSKQIRADEAFDLALANKLVPERSTVVCNDFSLEAPERILVVTGPNQGGKTTFARMFGQLHYLASLGLPVPGRQARLALPDRVFTHFEKEENITTLRGKLEDELVRVHEILQEATSSSVIIMNESFTSTTLNDALVLGTEVLTQIVELGALCVCVTFVDELASLSDATVSMVSTIVPDNPAERTYKIVRQPADGLAYAWAIAEKYGLSYESLRRRVAP